jgi:hypothetical protein
MFQPLLSSNLDFNQYFPVQHKTTYNYFVLNVDENKDFDVADNSDKFLCYLVQENGSTVAAVKFIFQKDELQPIMLLL